MSDNPPPNDLAADGGTAELDPWGSSTVDDYRDLFDRFGIEPFESILADVPDPHYLMRRGVIFGHRDYDRVTAAIRAGDPVAALSGFMPTGDPHIGHKLVFDELIWHQQQGADAFALIADLEAHSARSMDWASIDRHARDYVLSLIALGFDPDEGELYHQSTNRTVRDLAFELGIEANFSELAAIYGFDGETSVSHMESVLTQMADILYPQLDGPRPTVIPVGPDQDPHVRLARDLARRLRFFGVTEAYASFEAEPAEHAVIGRAYDALTDHEDIRCADAADWIETRVDDVPPEVVDRTIEKLRATGREPLKPRVRFLNRRAPAAAVEALEGAIDGHKRSYEEHIDAFELSIDEARDLVRSVEIDHGGYGFEAPSSIYHRFMSGLTGGKMSSSIPASHISLLDPPEAGAAKVRAATTGGRETAELQRELGGEADKCPVYELYAYLLCGDDDEYARRVYDECVGGDRLCGDCKAEAADLMAAFLADHQHQRDEAEAVLDEIDFDASPTR